VLWEKMNQASTVHPEPCAPRAHVVFSPGFSPWKDRPTETQGSFVHSKSSELIVCS
jgi:hypothetical protein